MYTIRKIIFVFLLSISGLAQENDSTEVVYKRRVLEASEIEFISSYYKQDGSHSAVSGGIGTEKLTDVASNIVLTIPLNADDVLTIDAGFSAYTSASSSNINPFFTDGSYVDNGNNTGASRGYAKSTKDLNRDSDDDDYGRIQPLPYGSPWIESTGASRKDVLTTLSANYSHSSDDRNLIWNANLSVSREYDYQSFGFGGGIAKLFNEKNSEISIKASAYLDKWKAIYPTELHEYAKYGFNFQNNGYFENVTVYDQYGLESSNYLPFYFSEFDNEKRNSYSLSLGFSQVLTKELQVSIFMDVLYQEGLLSTPYHRVYFADKANYYIGQKRYIPLYDTPQNKGIYRLADDVERLPDNRFKLPLGARLNYYINDLMVLRTYYRFYSDDWGLVSHTASIELPIKISNSFKAYPMYRFYTQKALDYFAPFEQHYSSEKYYTSDYDLSSFDSHQYGAGFSYAAVFSPFKIFKFGLKNVDFRYNHYSRSDRLEADIFTIAIKFVNQ
ncbi:DUF3570 domain-containing protein [Flavobacterium sp. WW92]|uniref:DUF3570 domain-containing protein n=1 Tax=unclassified Flavobacterium TaxID=196869 RepID=UPI0022258EE7|nr:MULTISPECIES: DUF3570 domain-containing protein [unclassified Flavobacterium]WDO12774.1 DUF3570 domain-containing protein [Flavobacterium sp. WW92]